MIKKYIYSVAIFATLTNPLQFARGASNPHHSTATETAAEAAELGTTDQFLQRAFKDNLQGLQEGHGFVVLDGGKMNASLKKNLLTNLENCKNDSDGWYAQDTKVFKMQNGAKATARTLIHYICGEGDQMFDDSILLIYPGTGKKWLLVPNAMANIDSIVTFGYSTRSLDTASLVIVGHSHAMGGGIDASKVIRVSYPEYLDPMTSVDQMD
jgi:hypothetical protein